MQSIRFSQSFSALKDLKDFKFFVIDRKVFDFYSNELSFMKDKQVFWVENPEEYKSFKYYERALDFFLRHQIRRNETLICIGGGATTDFGGFVASTLLRGINWLAIPTTLLAMVDASIGGKVGINTPRGKNLVGNFHNPIKTYICQDFLETLPLEQIGSGYGEIIKYSFLDHNIKSKIQDKSSIAEIIQACIEFKLEIVGKDFREEGIREILNFGHTFGHAFEKILDIEHGLAVALGIKLNLTVFTPALLEEFEKLVKQYSIILPTQRVDWEQFTAYLLQDKKNKRSDAIGFVTIQDNQVEKIELNVELLKRKLIESRCYEDFFL